MAITKQFVANKAKQVRRSKDGSLKQGSGDDNHMLVGPTGADDADQRRYRSLVQFAHVWTDVERLVKAELYVRVEDDSSHFAMGATPKVRVRRATEVWHDGTNGENVWTAGDYEAVNVGSLFVDAALALDPKTSKPVDAAWLAIDITELMRPLVPTGVAMVTGSPGGHPELNFGFVLATPNEANVKMRAIFLSWHAGGSHPYILITYDKKNTAPTAPTLTGPATSNNSFGDFFTGTHADPENDPMSARIIEVREKTGGKIAWTLPADLQVASSGETLTGTFSVPLSLATGSLKLGTEYEWRAATRDSRGLPASWYTTATPPVAVAAFSTWRALKIESSAPLIVATPVASITSLTGTPFGGTYSDVQSNPMDRFHLQMQVYAGGTADWTDPDRFVWDTGETEPTAKEVTDNLVKREYAGEPLSPANYVYRIRARDSTGAWSPWSEDTFTLTAPFTPDPGDNLVTQIGRLAPVRVALYKVGTNRGIGALIGHIDDPVDLGASAYMNGGGEMYFSLPALHPYCPEVEPHKVHYAVEQYVGDRYYVKFAGLITDFDADGDTVTFYGTDYLGLLQTAVDERYNASNAEEAAPKGSYYRDKKIDWIIHDQLTNEKALANSPLGFITVPTAGTASFSSLAESVTIYSTYSERLPFIVGLLDSHKQGTGREARLRVRPTNVDYTAWEWHLADNVGKDRPNIRLEWGGLVTDFRVVALGDFGTRVLGVGQKRGEYKVYRATGTGGMPEATWGRRSKTRFYQDITDQKDLQRRVNEDASQLAKVGKRIALALRADMLSPFDGWDIGDSIMVDIDRGVVQTLNYGSQGLWTILGVEWRYFADGHSDMTLTVVPKKTAGDPPGDLIGSEIPGLPLQWQTGYGVPSNYGVPPSPTPPPGGGALRTALPLTTDPVTGKQYTDLNTGCVYEVDESQPEPWEYTLVYCPESPPSTTVGPTPPSDPKPGDIWIDDSTDPSISYIWDGSGWVKQGGSGDPTPPTTPAIESLTSTIVVQEDGTNLAGIYAIVGYPAAPGLTDLSEIVVQVTRYTDQSTPPNPDWTKAVTRIVPSADAFGTDDTTVVISPVVSATPYYGRTAAIDVSGNRSDWSAAPYPSVQTASDLQAPAQPSGLVIRAGMGTIGVAWDPSTAYDYAYTEVQWREAGAASWEGIQNNGTFVVLAGLKNDVTYNVRLRTVDTSGNVLHNTGAVDGEGNTIYAHLKATDPDVGWVSGADATPTAIPATDLVWDSAMIESLLAGEIDADWIVAGTLKVGVGAGNADAIEVYDSVGNLVGRWSTEGIEILDPANPGYKMVIDEASLTIYRNFGTPDEEAAVTLTPLGIDAGSITFGSARGGHNLVQNSSFEMGRFGVVTTKDSSWDLAADWNAGGSRQGADVNVTTNASTITMTVI